MNASTMLYIYIVKRMYSNMCYTCLDLFKYYQSKVRFYQRYCYDLPAGLVIGDAINNSIALLLLLLLLSILLLLLLLFIKASVAEEHNVQTQMHKTQAYNNYISPNIASSQAVIKRIK